MKRSSNLSTCALVAVLTIATVLGGAFSMRSAGAQESTAVADMNGGDQILVATTIPRDQLPSGDGIVIIGRVVYEPGASDTCLCPDERGSVVDFIESGSLTYEIEQGARVIRAANSATPREEVVAAATRFTVGAGDAVIFPGKKRFIANEGSEPASFVFALMLAPVAPPPPDPNAVGETVGTVLGVVPGLWPDMGSESVALTFSRTTWKAGRLCQLSPEVFKSPFLTPSSIPPHRLRSWRAVTGQRPIMGLVP